MKGSIEYWRQSKGSSKNKYSGRESRAWLGIKINCEENKFAIESIML